MSKRESELVFVSILGTLLVVVALLVIVDRFNQEVLQPVTAEHQRMIEEIQSQSQIDPNWQEQLDAQSTPEAIPLDDF